MKSLHQVEKGNDVENVLGAPMKMIVESAGSVRTRESLEEKERKRNAVLRKDVGFYVYMIIWY